MRFELLKRELVRTNNIKTDLIRFGCTNFIGSYLLSNCLTRLNAVLPKISFSFQIDFFNNILDLLYHDQIHFAFVPESDSIAKNVSLTKKKLCQDNMVLIFHPSHKFANQDSVSAEELSEEDFLISQDKSATRSFVLSEMKKAGCELRRLQNFNNTEAIKNGVTNNLGISIISHLVVEKHLKNGLLVSRPLKGISLFRNIYCVHKTESKLSENENLFIQIFKQSHHGMA